MAPRILIVDDDPIIIQITAKVLTAVGYEVLKAVSGLEALKQADDIRPDLIIDEHRKQRPEHPTPAWQRVARRLSQKK